MSDTGSRFEKLVNVIAQLRNPVGGCPWDLEQDHKSLRPYVVEETYEVLEAIDRENDAELSGELGDLLLQVVLHAQVAKDRNAFTIDTVVDKIAEKMVRRHPHVFGDKKVSGSSEVLKNWEAIKYQERSQEKNNSSTEKPSMISGIPTAMPALLRSQRLGGKAAKANFDWNTLGGVWNKVEEELQELKVEIEDLFPKGRQLGGRPLTPEQEKRIGHEIGDLLFSVSQLARWLGLHGEDCLRECCERFSDRFRSMEEKAGQLLTELPEDKLEELWQQVKRSK